MWEIWLSNEYGQYVYNILVDAATQGLLSIAVLGVRVDLLEVGLKGPFGTEDLTEGLLKLLLLLLPLVTDCVV